MKKIILACDGLSFPESAFELIRQLNKFDPVFVTGVFLPLVNLSNLWSYSYAVPGGDVATFKIASEEDKVLEQIHLFETLCNSNDIQYAVHKDFNDFALPELRLESRFADVLVLSGQRFYQELMGPENFDMVADLLHRAECPVLVVPEQFRFPEELLVAYDGSEEAVYALKQFAYLFPELAKLRTTILYFDKDGNSEIPHKERLTELVQQHFPDTHYMELELVGEELFATWASEQKGTLLVGGAFGRSDLSRLLHKSFLHDAVKEQWQPLFITHK